MREAELLYLAKEILSVRCSHMSARENISDEGRRNNMFTNLFCLGLHRKDNLLIVCSMPSLPRASYVYSFSTYTNRYSFSWKKYIESGKCYLPVKVLYCVYSERIFL